MILAAVLLAVGPVADEGEAGVLAPRRMFSLAEEEKAGAEGPKRI